MTSNTSRLEHNGTLRTIHKDETSVSLFQGDIMDFLQSLPDDSADLILADPPYNMGFDKGKGWDTFNSEQDYLEFMDAWTRLAYQKLKPGRVMLVWGTMAETSFLKYRLNTLETLPGAVSQNELLVERNWGGRTKKNFARKYELCWSVSKGKTFLFNSDDVLQERVLKRNLRTGKAYDKGTIPTSIFRKHNIVGGKDHVSFHPTQKSIPFLRTVIRAYTNPNDTVISLFSGSFSDGLASLREGRSCLGVEKDPEYAELSWERVLQETSTLNNTKPLK